MGELFANTYPEEIDQDRYTGVNDIRRASIMRVTYIMDKDRLEEELGIEPEWLDKFELHVEEEIVKFNDIAVNLKVYVFTITGFI